MTNNTLEIQNDDIKGVTIRIGGQIVAWFLDPEKAEEWASEHYFGQWLMNPYSIPNKPPFTKEELEIIYKDAENLLKNFKEGKRADPEED